MPIIFHMTVYSKKNIRYILEKTSIIGIGSIFHSMHAIASDLQYVNTDIRMTKYIHILFLLVNDPITQ